MLALSIIGVTLAVVNLGLLSVLFVRLSRKH